MGGHEHLHAPSVFVLCTMSADAHALPVCYAQLGMSYAESIERPIVEVAAKMSGESKVAKLQPPAKPRRDREAASALRGISANRFPPFHQRHHALLRYLLSLCSDDPHDLGSRPLALGYRLRVLAC